MTQKTPQLGRPEVITPLLSAKCAARADRLVRDIVSDANNNIMGGWTDEKILVLRVIIGMALHDAASYGLLDAYVRRAVSLATPLATSKTDPAHTALEDATTRRYRRAQNPERK